MKNSGFYHSAQSSKAVNSTGLDNDSSPKAAYSHVMLKQDAKNF